jgi:hypothetical protein
LKRTAVINVVGLTPSLLGPATPRLAQFLRQGAVASVVPAFPAVTCTAQSNYLTGAAPARHGIVANGWYNRELAEVQFWKQSNHLVGAPKIWEQLRQSDSRFTCAQLFWWFNMYSTADYSITPRPIYPADGRKIFDIYTWPYGIREEIKRDLGEFPFAGVLGAGGGRVHFAGRRGRGFAVDRRIGPMDRKEIRADVEPDLSAAPGLQFAAARAGGGARGRAGRFGAD